VCGRLRSSEWCLLSRMACREADRQESALLGRPQKGSSRDRFGSNRETQHRYSVSVNRLDADLPRTIAFVAV
jgi:hypothetical protein